MRKAVRNRLKNNAKNTMEILCPLEYTLNLEDYTALSHFGFLGRYPFFYIYKKHKEKNSRKKTHWPEQNIITQLLLFHIVKKKA